MSTIFLIYYINMQFFFRYSYNFPIINIYNTSDNNMVNNYPYDERYNSL